MSNPLQAEFERRCALPSDINEHLPTLSCLAMACEGDVAEFGVRMGNSTVALLHGLFESQPWPAGHTRTLHSYDLAPAKVEIPLSSPAALWWLFTRADTAKLAHLPPVDVLFIDTLHTCDQVRAELVHATQVRIFIVLHDTILFGSAGEHGQAGITHAIYDFLAKNLEWSVHAHYPNNNGLLVLRREVAAGSVSGLIDTVVHCALIGLQRTQCGEKNLHFVNRHSWHLLGVWFFEVVARWTITRSDFLDTKYQLSLLSLENKKREATLDEWNCGPFWDMQSETGRATFISRRIHLQRAAKPPSESVEWLTSAKGERKAYRIARSRAFLLHLLLSR